MVRKTVRRIHRKVRESHENLDKNVFLSLLATGIVFVWMLTGLFSSKEDKDHKKDQIVLKTVEVRALEHAPYAEKIKLSTTVKAKKITLLKAETTGRVIRTPLERGQFVKKGDLILELDNQDKNEALAAAQAELKEAQTLYASAKQLNKEGYRAKSALETQKARLEKARRDLKKAEDNLSFARISSPFDGYFDDRFVSVGSFVSMGDSIGVLFKTDAYHLEGFISQKDRHLAHVGKKVYFSLENGTTGEGVISFVSAYGDAVTKTYRVLVDISGKGQVLPLNMSAAAFLEGDTHLAVAVPYSALILDDEGHLGVMVVDVSETASFHRIDPLADTAEGYYIKNVPEKARLIIKGQHSVHAGEHVIAKEVSHTTGDAS